jgi:hypothetical protein
VAFPTSARAQDKTATGTITSVSGSSLVVKVAGQDTTFMVDAKTTVETRGAGTADRKAEAAGAAGPKITDLLKAGQNVEVTYMAMGAMNHATKVRTITSLPSDGGKMGASAAGTMTSTGTVSAVGSNTLTINASSGPQTFTIDGASKVVGHGAGTAAAKEGGKALITDLVAVGDRVSVSYHQTGATMHAAEVRVTDKAKK